MKITHLRVENYKGLREIDIPLSRFSCLIGENNAGKSSVLQALALFFSGTALSKGHYFDASRPVRIAVSLGEIVAADINRLAEEHRSKITAIVKNDALTLVRLYGADGKSTLKYRKLLPNEARFADDAISELVKGKRAGQPFVTAVTQVFPELNDVVTAAMNQGEIKDKIQALADSLPDNQKSPADVDLPTGIDKSVSAMLPEPIYIPAVKDLKDDVKTTESTPFGKVLGILLKAIEPLLAEERTLFAQLNAKLNRVTQADGSETDERLTPVKTIESTVERFVQDSFKAVKLRITVPPPELKAVLSSAVIFANDGVDGPIDTKGDGLRRAIVFAILRSYVELNKTGLIAPDQPAPAADDAGHLLLFEEPELYLHPRAQQILFDALGTFSQRHPVVVTTHSPVFFGPQSTTTFVKMRKRADAAISPKPFAVVHPIELGDTTARDQFQIICYENNNIAFFAETVVLVEGDSDYIVFPHLARVVNAAWDCSQLPIRFARIGGKSNIRRYRDFFRRFETRVIVITDLDFLLGGEFTQIDPSEPLKAQRSELLAAVDAVIQENGGVVEPNAARIADAQRRTELRGLWQRARNLKAQHLAGQASLEDLMSAVDDFFAWERYWARRDTLMQCPTPQLLADKRALLAALRAMGVCVLERGSIDDYYPAHVTGDSKPARAQSFCNAVLRREDADALCDANYSIQNGAPISEWRALLEPIFSA